MSSYRNHWLWGSIPQPNDDNYEYNYREVRERKQHGQEFASYMAEKPLRYVPSIEQPCPLTAIVLFSPSFFSFSLLSFSWLGAHPQRIRCLC